MNRPRSRALRSAVIAACGLTIVGLTFGYLLKIPCTYHEWDGFQYRSSCYNDIFALYSFRGISEGRFPYLQTDLEYPVATGLFVGAAGKVTDDGRGFFQANAVGLAAFAFAATVALTAMAADRKRILAWALAPPLVLYAFHNWDLLAVGLSALALYAFWRGADRSAGALVGLGAAAKLFPGLLLVPFVLHRRREQGRWPWPMIVWTGGAFAAINFPILIANPDGWLYPWQFHSTRFPNFENVWYFLYRHASGLGSSDFWFGPYPRLVSVVSGVVFAGASVLLVRAELKRETVRPFVLAFGLLCLFLLTSKVLSPQYALWLLPFFVLLDIPIWGMASFVFVDAAVWFSISAYFLAVQHGVGDAEMRLTLTEVAVFARYAVIGWLLYRSRKSQELVSLA